MGLENFILTCEKDNEELRKDVDYYKNMASRLKKEIDYLKSGEYINQLRFERDVLQDIANKGEISKEDRNFIDCTHRNTELLEENQELKKQYCERTDCVGRLGVSKKVEALEKENEELKKQLEDMTLCRDIASGHRQEVQDRETILLNQQKEFIKYLEKIIIDSKAGSGQQYYYQVILQKYKEIIGDDK